MKRIKDFCAYYRFEIQTVAFLAAFSGAVALWVRNRPQNHYVQLAYAAVCLVLGLGFYFSYRALWRQKWRAPIVFGARKVLVGASKYLMKLLNRFTFFHRKGNLVTGRTSVSYDLTLMRRQERRRRRGDGFKPPKWKDMETNRQKLGFLYYRVITNRIKHGAVVTSHETPLEISARFNDNEAENRLFAMYISARYDERKELGDNEILDLKDKILG